MIDLINMIALVLGYGVIGGIIVFAGFAGVMFGALAFITVWASIRDRWFA